MARTRWLTVSLGFLWLGVAACNGHVEGGGGAGGGMGVSGGGGTGGSTIGSGCPLAVPGICAPVLTCTNGVRRTGQATCENGTWVCTEEPCSIDGGVGGGCTGSLQTVCVGGKITSSCCPAGAPCAFPLLCDLGGGNCIADVPCSEVDAGACASIHANQFNQTCKVASDCAAVYEGSLCSMCYCPNAAINNVSLSTYQSDLAASSRPNVCDCVATHPVQCVSGTCVLPAL